MPPILSLRGAKRRSNPVATEIATLTRHASSLAMTVLAYLLLLLPNAAAAIGVVDYHDFTPSQNDTTTKAGGLLKGLDDCIATGNCTLCELFSVLSNAVNIILAIAGSVALGMILWHAFGLVGSRGNAEAIKGSREGIWKIAIGFFFLLMSYELIILVIRVLAGNFSLDPPWQGLTCARTVISK